MLSSLFQQFHFEQPAWLWGLLLMPFIWLLYRLFYRHQSQHSQLNQFADPHLLPHLIKGDHASKAQQKTSILRTVLIASLLWCLGVMAMAGPLWDFKETEVFKPTDSLVILLDLSKSMDVQDSKPSRLTRAHQEIEDLNRTATGVNIGLIAFANIPHVITPLTDDHESLTRLLPSLKTNLVYSQGSHLAPALKRAGEMLSFQNGNEKHILVMTDGDFNDSDAAIFHAENDLKLQGVHIHFMGVGSEQGAPIPDGKNGYVKDNGQVVISKLEQQRLKSLADDGDGIYVHAHYLDQDTARILAQITPSTDTKAQQTVRTWEQGFYIFLAPLMALILLWFRKGAGITVLLVCITLFQPQQAQAAEWQNLFLNEAQQGKQALDNQQYESAAKQFSDPYRRGVAEYKAGQYEQAAASFAQAQRESVQKDAQYNLGNAQLMAGQVNAAINTYESILKQSPDNQDALHNLEIAKKLQQQQNQNNVQNKNNESQQSEQQQQNSNQSANNQQQPESQKQNANQQQAGNDNQTQQQNQRAQQDQSKVDQQQANAENTEQHKQQQASSDSQQQQADNDKQTVDQQQQANADSEQQQSAKQAQAQPSQGDETEQSPSEQANAEQIQRLQQDVNADQWLNRIKDEPEQFLKNKFYIESKRQGAEAVEKPW